MTEEDRPLPIKEAAQLFGFTPSTLRAESSRGRLVIFKIGKKQYTSVADIKTMIRLCRAEGSKPAFTTTRPVTAGSYATPEPSCALGSLMASLPTRNAN